jgi:multidrug efflux pump subunit AcrB
LFFTILPKETAPYDDRSMILVNVTGQEGATYDYMDRVMQDLSELITDSIPEKKVSLIVTSPGFGAAAVNRGFSRISLIDADQRDRSQADIAKSLSQSTQQFSEVKMSVSEQPTISVNKRGGLPVQYIIQAQNFKKLEESIPSFMEEIAKDPTFSTTDVNLKFNKPEIHITIEREKAESLGVSVMDVAQTLQMSLSGQRFGYFLMNGKQYQVMGQFDIQDRNQPNDLNNIFFN